MIFLEKEHAYYNGEERYGGVTTLLSQFQDKPDWDKIADNWVKKRSRKKVLTDLAKKWKITYGQARRKWGNDEFTGPWLRSVWKEASERSLIAGSYYHHWAELQEKDTAFYNPVIDNKKEFRGLENLKKGTYLELGVYSHLHKLSGQADKVIFTTDTSFKMLDFKTNWEKPDPKPSTFYDKSAGYSKEKRFLSPISHLPDNNYYKYALQLSIYSYMLELYGYKCEGCTILYVNTEWRHPYNVKDELVIFEDLEFDRVRVVLELEPIEVPYLKEEAKAILKHRKNNL